MSDTALRNTSLVALALAFAAGPSMVAGQDAPDAEWFTSYNGSREESHGHYILECEDGGFLQVGETGYVNVNARILVVKTDEIGRAHV